MRRLFFTACLSLCLSGAFAAEYEGHDWPHWLGPHRNGISPETGWTVEWGNEPSIAWRKKLGTGFASVAVVDGRLYAMGNANRPDRGSYYDTIYCLDAATGDTLWEHSYPCRLVNRFHEGGPSASPAVHDGRVYTLSKVGQVFCLDAKTGQVLWQADLPQLLEMKVPQWGFTSSPVIEDGKLIFQAGATVALDLKDGELIWKSKERPASYSTPAPFELDGRKLLASLNTDGVSIIDTGTGEELGFVEWETESSTNATTPIVSGNKVFLSSGYHKGCGLFEVDSAGGLTPIYRNDKRSETMANHFQTSVLLDGYLYGFDGNSHNPSNVDLVCLEFDTGKQRWRHNGLGAGSLIASDGKLIVLSEKGQLMVADASPESFKPISGAQVLGGRCWTAPVLSHGRVYCRNAKGDLVCVDLRSGQ